MKILNEREKERKHSIYHTNRPKTETFSKHLSDTNHMKIEMLKDDDAWLKFTFPFPFIMFAGAECVVMIFFERGL